MNSVEAIEALRRSRVALLTTYRRNGEPVATPVSIAVRVDGIYFVTPATSGKARRLTAHPEVTLAPSTVSGRATGPTTMGRARLLSETERRHTRRLRQPGGRLFWSYLLYRVGGHRMLVYEVHLAEPASGSPRDTLASRNTAKVHRAVQVTARGSALLFTAAQASSALGPRTGRTPRRLYLAFLAAHAVHFSVVTLYAKVNGGRDLFPGGRSMNEVGGWAAVVGIFTFFAGIAATGWVTGAPRPAGGPAVRAIGLAATWVMTAMFVSVYLGQLPRLPWSAVPATVLAGATTANVLAGRRRRLSAERSAR